MIGFIDPYIISPVTKCFEQFQNNFGPAFHHKPTSLGMKSLFDNASRTSAYYVAGSASNVTEPLDWHGPVAQFLIAELKLGRPVFGACFGHQLLCHAFGSHVNYANPTQDKILGMRKIKLLKSLWSFDLDEEFLLPVTHRQVVTQLGSGLLAVGHAFSNDMVIHESLPLFTTQAHPEASEHFCELDIKILTGSEISEGTRHGHRLIKAFLDHYKIR